MGIEKSTIGAREVDHRGRENGQEISREITLLNRRTSNAVTVRIWLYSRFAGPLGAGRVGQTAILSSYLVLSF